MNFRLYDTRRRDKIPFVPIEEGKIGMYVCGVTVYDMCHLGHARFMVAFDAIYRYLKELGYEVKYVRNFTDVDDKIIKRAAERGVSCEQLTEQYIQEFYTDFDALGCLRPEVEPRVSTHMPEIIAIISKIVANGHGYESDGDVYFDISSFPAYGGLSGRTLEDMMAGASDRLSEAEQQRKRHPMDFALWKASKPGEPTWDSPWGPGRPGWHIECTAMSCKHLGTNFDIHGGGKDLVFPHHENEIAQAVAGTGDGYANHWMHNGFVNVDAEKMSKSLGNFFTVRDVLEVYHPEVIRFFLLSTHYRSPINYSDRNLEGARRRVIYIYETLQKIRAFLAEHEGQADTGQCHEQERIEGVLPAFEEAMADDFNTAKVLGLLSDVIRCANEIVDRGKKKAPHKLATLRAFERVLEPIARTLGLFLRDPAEVLADIQRRLMRQLELDEAWVQARIDARNEARGARDFERADVLRKELLARHVCIMDTPAGTLWKVLPPGGSEREDDCAATAA